MTEYYIDLPLTDHKIEDFLAGDIIYLSGVIGTGRDHVHKRVIKYVEADQDFPKNFHYFQKGAIYHMGPIVKQDDDGSYHIISGGPTTSARMNQYQAQVSQALETSFVIGKGGMDNVPWSDIHAIYLSFPGGAGAIVSKFIQKIIGVEWIDLGTPEAVWFCDVKEFGPLIVSIDTHRTNLYTR